MVPTGLKIISKSVAFAARFITPLFLLFLFIASNIFNLNELKVSKFLLDGFCNNEKMDGLGRIVCPIVPMEDPFLNNTDLNLQNNTPILVSTTKIKDNVVINADSSTPSSLYLILQVCNHYENNKLNKSTLLEDLCVLINDTIRDANKESSFNGNVYNGSDELVDWKNVAALMQNLPNSGKLLHISLLSGLNKNKILGSIIESILGLREREVFTQSREFYRYAPREEDSAEPADLLVTSDILSFTGDPFQVLSEVAFPKLIHNKFGTVQESVYRLFLSFPEASAALIHMRSLGFDSIDFCSFEPKVDRFTYLAVFLSSFQLILTYSFESVLIYTGIVKSSYSSDVSYERFRYWYLLSEFTVDSESKTFIENIANALNGLAINLAVRNKLFMVGEIGLKFTRKLLDILVLMDLPPINTGSNVATAPMAYWNQANDDSIKIITFKLREALMHLGKFISFDQDSDGYISFEEFTKASIDLNSFVNDVISVVNTHEQYRSSGYESEGENERDGVSNGPIYGKYDELQFVNLLKSQNSLYDKIIDEFIISDVDRNDLLSVEEFIELTLSTCIVENIHT